MALFSQARLKPRWWWLVVVLIVFAVGYRIAKPAADAKAGGFGGFDRAVPVAVITAARGDLNLSLNALGTVIPAQAVTVKSRVDGQLLRVHFQEGQFVKAGDLLAEIDPRAFDVQLAQAQGQLARDTALLKNAQIDLERYEMLWSQDSIAKQEVDAQASLVRQYEGAVKVDEGQIADAKLQLSYAKITAPVGGRVGLKQVDPGNIVHTSDTGGIVTITQIQPIYVLFTLPEDNLPRLLQKLNSKQQVAIDAYDRSQKLKLASGMLNAIDNQIDTATGTLKIKAQFSNDDNSLFPNQFVNVRLQIDTLRDRILAPVEAVQTGAEGHFVYVLQADGSAKLQAVQLGESDGKRVVIDRGLDDGAVVIVEGLEQLRDGSKVDVVKRDGQKVEASATSAESSGEKPKKFSGKRNKPAGE